MTKIELAFQRTAMAALILCASAVLYVGHWFWAPYDAMQIKSLRILTPQVEVGDFIEYELVYCKPTGAEFARAQIHLSLTDGIIYNLPIESGPLPDGCRTALFVLEAPSIPEGTYRLEMTREYSVNPVRTIEVRAVSGLFKISGRRRLHEMLRQQLPEVIPEVIPQIPELR